MSVKKKRIYLDYAATTPVDKKVLAVMQSYFDYQFGNASEIHDWGREAKEAIEKARGQVARALGANEKEIIFTSCATESINLSHKGLIEAIRDARGETKPHIITTQIEHKAVLETCKHLEMAGLAEVTYLPVDNDGLVNLADLEKAIKPETVLVSVMYVNNEVGIIEPITEMGKLLQQINTSRIASHLPRIYFHTDATQAIQYLDCDVNKLGVDLLSLTGHKFYAPKGIGILYCRGGTPLAGQQHGGGQEFGRRAGTENVPYIAGLGQAIEEAANRRAEISTRLEKLRDRLIEKILQIPQVILTGHPQQRSPHIASFIVKGV